MKQRNARLFDGVICSHIQQQW